MLEIYDVEVHGLEKSWPKVAVHLDTSVDDLIRTIPKTSVLPIFQWKRTVDLNAEWQIKQSHPSLSAPQRPLMSVGIISESKLR